MVEIVVVVEKVVEGKVVVEKVVGKVSMVMAVKMVE